MRFAVAALMLTAGMTAQDWAGRSYHFVDLSVSPSQARSGGGTLRLAADGTFRVSGKAGVNEEAAAPLEMNGRWEAAAGDKLRLGSPLRPGATLELRWNSSREVLIGTSADAGSGTHELLVAVAAGAESTTPEPLNAAFAGGYFLVQDGRRGRLATGLVQFSLTPGGGMEKLKVTGHASWIDDVNRIEEQEGGDYRIAGATGTVNFPAQSDIVSGTRRVFLSASRGVLIGFGEGPGERDILIAPRRHPEPALFQFAGDHYLFDLFAENTYVFEPDAARFGSTGGVMRISSEGPALVRTQVHANGRTTFLSTVNAVAVGQDGSAGIDTVYRPGINNFAFDGGGDVFAGAQVGFPGELTLEHGVFAGFRMPRPAAGAVVLSPFAGPAAPNALLTLEGTGLAGVTGATMNGADVPVSNVSATRLSILVPSDLTSAEATIAVRGGAGTSNAITVAVVAAAPRLVAAAHADFSAVTAASPAAPGETILLLATGLGPRVDEGLQVSMAGQAAEVLFAGEAPGFVGLYQLNVRVPADVPIRRSVPLALAATGGFSDAEEIPIR